MQYLLGACFHSMLSVWLLDAVCIINDDIHNIHGYYWIVRHSTGVKSAIGVLRYTIAMSFTFHG